MTNEEVIRKLAATYPPEEIIAAALVAICMIAPMEPTLACSVGLAALEVILERDSNRFFKPTNTVQ